MGVYNVHYLQLKNKIKLCAHPSLTHYTQMEQLPDGLTVNQCPVRESQYVTPFALYCQRVLIDIV